MSDHSQLAEGFDTRHEHEKKTTDNVRLTVGSASDREDVQHQDQGSYSAHKKGASIPPTQAPAASEDDNSDAAQAASTASMLEFQPESVINAATINANRAKDQYESSLSFHLYFLAGFCTRLAGSSCERCLKVCPHGAITLEDNLPKVQTDRCTTCGLCAGVCDAFAFDHITLEDLSRKVERLSEQGDPVFFVCTNQLPEGITAHRSVILLPCIAALPPEFWFNILAQNSIPLIYCDFSICDECERAGLFARELFTRAINLAELWANRSMGRAKAIPQKNDLLSKFVQSGENDYNRRGVLSGLADQVEDIASGRYRKRNSDSLYQFHARNEKMRAQGHLTNPSHKTHTPSSASIIHEKLWPRLKLFEDAIRLMPERASVIDRYTAGVDYELCEQCHRCLAHCPAGARRLAEQGYPVVNRRLCIACGTCCEVCPHQANYLYSDDAARLYLDDGQS